MAEIHGCCAEFKLVVEGFSRGSAQEDGSGVECGRGGWRAARQEREPADAVW